MFNTASYTKFPSSYIKLVVQWTLSNDHFRIFNISTKYDTPHSTLDFLINKNIYIRKSGNSFLFQFYWNEIYWILTKYQAQC